MKEIKVSVVPFEVYTEYDYIDVGNFYILSATGDRYYFHTSDREAAQRTCNDMFGLNHYIVKTSKIMKTKSKQESGGYSATGSNTRKAMMPHLKGLTKGA